MILLHPVLVAVCVSLASAVTVLSWPPLNCSRQGLRCKVTTSYCMDSGWLEKNRYTPSSPEGLQVSVDTRRDEAGRLQPVLSANWSIKDDGSIRYLTATELHVLVMAPNQNLCVRYSFKEKLSMRSPTGEKWSFSANMLVLDPGQMYHVCVVNIPKPELDHSSYDVCTDVTVPDCPHPNMQTTEFCVERGSLWRPDISLTQTSAVGGRSALAVSFTPNALCEEYMVIVSCSTTQHVERTYKANQKTLNVTFDLDRWPRFCCQFDVQIKPFFPPCGQDCARRHRTLDLCLARPTGAPDVPDVPAYTFVVLGVAAACAATAGVACALCRKRETRVASAPAAAAAAGTSWRRPLQPPPKLLVIYSHDHRLYRDVVLKLCAFLQAKCRTEVLVDLLDSASVGVVGRLRWLERQRQRLQNPSDKILVLCSRGVQAKWRALCGQGRVTLREDVLSPTDDMLTPFLNLFLPDMHRAGTLGRYLVAYFDDVGGECDVPSVFDIGVKYKLMKHFEELYLRILDIEKYQPGHVTHVEGVGPDEYFRCPSGRALRDAIEAFRVHQVENPDWFEKECVTDEEEVLTERHRLLDRPRVAPVLERVPLVRVGPPVLAREVEINRRDDRLLVLTPELDPDDRTRRPESVYVLEPVVNNPDPPRRNRLGPIPTEDEEEEEEEEGEGSRSAGSEKRSSVPPRESGNSRPRERRAEGEELEGPGPRGTGPGSGSDQGYSSRTSSQHGAPGREDPLEALRRLQDELFQKNPGSSDPGPEGS
ncbi:interleukin 17 receptor A1a [Pseudoliparis swirei]|uniref:interleukin 17 receptor A1a n=1 Tax=Pseudoliparis swirei TaxID=2059687 RepID=UPI0024BE0045|nr:interleukin 17 receptor A1a [Pseudoliparis swirei]